MMRDGGMQQHQAADASRKYAASRVAAARRTSRIAAVVHYCGYCSRQHYCGYCSRQHVIAVRELRQEEAERVRVGEMEGPDMYRLLKQHVAAMQASVP